MKEILYDWQGYNSEIFYFLNHIGNIGVLPAVLRCLSWLFNIENFAAYYMLLCALCYRHYKATSKEHNASNAAEKNEFWFIYGRVVYAGVCYAVFGLIYAALKFSVNLPRPFCSLPPGTFETVMNTADERCMSSFPSSHAGLAFMITLLSRQYLGTCGLMCAVVVTAAVAFSRIALAMHYPADILYSYMTVLIVFYISGIIFKLFENNLIKYVGKRILEYQHAKQTL